MKSSASLPSLCPSLALHCNSSYFKKGEPEALIRYCPHGHVIVKPNLLIFKLIAGYGYLFFGLCPT